MRNILQQACVPAPLLHRVETRAPMLHKPGRLFHALRETLIILPSAKCVPRKTPLAILPRVFDFRPPNPPRAQCTRTTSA
jgi:hypothetical protein